ncbi:MAG: Fur family transcriptional regulator [Elusimicrobiota bacterium]
MKTARTSPARQAKELFIEYLAAHGLRFTRQRLLVLDHLLSSGKHQSTDAIYQTLRRQGVGRATVFRNLKMLAKCGIISNIRDPKGISNFEVTHNRPHHDHLICIKCDAIHEVRWPELERIQQRICRKTGFEPRWHRHEIFGVCARCRKAR